MNILNKFVNALNGVTHKHSPRVPGHAHPPGSKGLLLIDVPHDRSPESSVGGVNEIHCLSISLGGIMAVWR